MRIPFSAAQTACVDRATAAEVADFLGLPLERLAYCGSRAALEDELTAYPPLRSN